jgi:hypothetical protein
MVLSYSVAQSSVNLIIQMSDGDGDDDGQELQEPVETTAAADTVTTPTIGPDSDLMTGQEQPSDQILGTTGDPDASKRKKKPQVWRVPWRSVGRTLWAGLMRS